MKDISNYVESVYNSYGNVLIINKRDFSILSNVDNNIGYCSKYKSIYNVTYSVTKDNELNTRVMMHEYGHIYLGHLEGIHEEMDKNLVRLIKNKDTYLIDQINKNCNIDYAESILEKVINNSVLNHSIHNIAMDMEINSTILDKDDVLLIKDRMNDLIKKEIEDLKSSNRKISIREFNNLISKYDMKGVHPSDFEFNEGLTYPDYLVLLILNLDKVMNLLTNKFNDSKSGSEFSGSSDNKMDAKSSDNIPETEDEFKEFLDELSNALNSSTDDLNSQDDHGSESRDKSDDDKRSDPDKYIDSCIGNSHSTTTRDYNVNFDPLTMCLKEILNNVRSKVIKRKFMKDPTYKYNRRILGNNKIISPTYKQKITRTDNPTVVFFVDVSGSMDSSLVDKIITTIKTGMDKIDRSLKYNLITWDTELCEYYKDLSIKSPIPKITYGGGTRLAGTFDLFKKDFDKNAVMVLISDFEDDLDEWNNKESSMSGYTMYGIKYGNYSIRNTIKWINFKVRECNDK